MTFDEIPQTSSLHNDWRKRIKIHFEDIDFSSSSDYLSLIKYLENPPEKFYSQEAFKKYFSFLENTKNRNPTLLAEILRASETLLSISNKILTELLSEPIHDVLLPKNHNDLINFIDNNIHYNLLKVYETPFFQFIYIIAKFHWINEKKGLDGLDLRNAVEQLKKVDFDFIGPFYLHNVRNGIAHGKVVFSDLDITYSDKKGNNEKLQTKKIIKIFDGIVDITNGFCLAFKAFCFTNPSFFEKYNIPIPQSILLEELKAKTNSPAWKITNCLESIANHGKSQLIIYIENGNWDFNKVQFYSFFTAFWAEKLTKSYDRIFFSIITKSSNIPTGWAAFDAKKLKKLREQGFNEIKDYQGVLEDNLIFFMPRFRLPKFMYKLGTYASIVKITFPLALRNVIKEYRPKSFVFRESQMHSKYNHAIVQDPSIIITRQFQDNIKGLIVSNHKKIVKIAIVKSRKECSVLSKTKYLPVKYVRVFIYDTDKRLRDLRHSGLIPELVATIEVNSSKRIQTIDIFGGTPEIHGKYRIVWNRNWKYFSDI